MCFVFESKTLRGIGREYQLELPLDEKQLIQQLINGHPASWSEFVSRFQGLVAHGVRHTARQCQFELSAAEIEDICAEVFASLIVKNFRSLRQFRGQCRISTWLMVISRRVCLSQLSRLRRASDMLRNMEISSRQTVHSDLLSRMVRAEQSEAIRSSFKKLNDKDRLLLDLYFQEQLSYAEIGEQAGISINSVGPMLGRAIVRLRKLLGRV